MLFTVFTPLLNNQQFTFNMEIYFNLFLSDSAFIIWAFFYHIRFNIQHLYFGMFYLRMQLKLECLETVWTMCVTARKQSISAVYANSSS